MSKTNKAGRFFDTIADVGSLAMAILYVLYVTLLLIFDLVRVWLNYCMLIITIAYIAFFLIKIFSLNRILAQKNVQRTARLALRYSKWSMKIINALFVVLSVTATHYSSDSVIMMIGVFVVVFSFLLSLLWDAGWFIIRRRIRDIRADWESLSTKEKNNRIAVIIESFVRSLDSVTGIDLAQSVTIGAGRIAEGQDKKRGRDKNDVENAVQDDKNEV